MRYAPKKYDPALLEALALAGALDPNLAPDARRSAIEKVAGWQQQGDPEAVWTGEMAAEGGYLLRRLWRGVLRRGRPNAAQRPKSVRVRATGSC